MFDWIPIYKEIAEKLLEFKDNRKPLIDLLISMKEEGLKVLPLNDKSKDIEGFDIILQDIDPFTFYVNFNRGITNKNRIEIIEYLKKEWNLQSNVPTEFIGIPVANNQKSWFFSWQYDRGENDIELLWSIFGRGLNNKIEDIPEELFNECLNIKGVSAYLTFGLYWVNPENFIALDKNSRSYIPKNYNLDVSTINKLKYSGYKELINKLKGISDMPFYEISYHAWNEQQGNIGLIKNGELITEFLKSEMYTEFRDAYLKPKINREREAWNLIEKNKDEIGSKILSQFMDIVDKYNNKPGWFGLMLMGNNRNQILNTEDYKLNELVSTLLFSDLDYETAIERCTKELKVPGASYGFLSLLLYLSDPEEYNVFIPKTAETALNLISNVYLNKYKDKIEKFKVFNETAKQIRDRYNLQPQEMDWFFNNILVYHDKMKPNISNGSFQFSDLIEKLKSNADFNSEFSLSNIQEDFAWIGDKSNLVGNETVHYEIIKRNNKFFIECHFETEKSKYFTNKLEDLPSEFQKFKWINNTECVRIKNGIDMSEDDIEQKVIDQVKLMDKEIGDKIRQQLNEILNTNSLNKILYGPPGTGKTYHTKELALNILGEKTSDLSRDEINELYKKYQDKGQIEFVTFHQSFSYEDFIEGIKPVLSDDFSSDGSELEYQIKDGVFKKLCYNASYPSNPSFENAYNKLLEALSNKPEGIIIEVGNKKVEILSHPNGMDLKVNSPTYIKNITKEGLKYVSDSNRFVGTWGQYYKAIFKLLSEHYGYNSNLDESPQNHVLIIDEINRGNIANIFGELITLIEDDKRKGNEEELETILPYSKTKFSVPNNVYIIGTMNTADRSVEALDTALRRRFSFVEKQPEPSLLLKPILINDTELQLDIMLVVINKRIEVLLDRDHCIGHSYFMKLSDCEDPFGELKNIFRNKVIPLLQEYFYGDLAKIGLILGNDFIEPVNIVNPQKFFADYEYENAEEFLETQVVRIKNIDQLELESFKKIYE